MRVKVIENGQIVNEQYLDILLTKEIIELKKVYNSLSNERGFKFIKQFMPTTDAGWRAEAINELINASYRLGNGSIYVTLDENENII